MQPEITQAQAQAWKAAGLLRCCLAMDTSPATANSASALAATGIALEAYRELSGPGQYVAQVQDAIAGFAPLSSAGITFARLWLTAEDETVGVAPAVLVPAFRAAVNACGSLAVGVYTGSWYWPDWMGNDTSFATLPLWHASYDEQAVIEPVSYGGWTLPAAHQYASPVTVAGVALDLDVWTVDGPAPQPNPQVPQSVKDAIDTLGAWKATL